MVVSRSQNERRRLDPARIAVSAIREQRVDPRKHDISRCVRGRHRALNGSRRRKQIAEDSVSVLANVNEDILPKLEKIAKAAVGIEPGTPEREREHAIGMLRG